MLHFFDWCVAFVLNTAVIIGSIGNAICVFPVTYIYDFFFMFHPDLFRHTSPVIHAQKVEKLQKQVLKWNANGRKKKMCTNKPWWKSFTTRSIDKSNWTKINISGLEDIIEIDTTKMIIKVEPGLQFGTLTHKLVPQGLTVPVIPELENTTIGGIVLAAGGQSSCHKYSVFSAICLEYEVVLADGSVVTCSKTENTDLFYAIPCSYGTLGFLTSITLPLIKAGKYVKVEYHLAHDINRIKDLISKGENEFIDGISFNRNQSIIMLGNFSDNSKNGQVARINRWYKPFYYKHVESFLSNVPTNKENVNVEYIPTRDYYHRYSRGIFWILPTIASVLNKPVYLFFFGWIYPQNMNLMKLFTSFLLCFYDIALSYIVIQDMGFPIDKLEEAWTFVDEQTGIYPLWLCPVKLFPQPGAMSRPDDGRKNMYVDIGIFGKMTNQKKREVGGSKASFKAIEKFVVDNNGGQLAYSDCYLNRKDFAKLYDLTLYNKMRERLNCLDAFPDVYEKVSIHYKKGFHATEEILV